MPYELEVEPEPVVLENIKQLNATSVIRSTRNLGSIFYKIRENESVGVAPERSRKHNSELLSSVVHKEISDAAYLDEYDDTMAEVLENGREGDETIIGSTTRLCQHVNGIMLEGNCIVAVSDANGVIGLNNRWNATSVSKSVAHIDLAHKDLSLLQKTIFNNVERELVQARPVYV